jgi:transcriptional regulator with XRE-family HTH domain
MEADALTRRGVRALSVLTAESTVGWIDHERIPDSQAYGTLQDYLEGARAAVGMGRERFSMVLGLSASAVQQVIKGRSGPGGRFKAALHERLGITMEEIERLAADCKGSPRHPCAEPECVALVWVAGSRCERHFSAHREYALRSCRGCSRDFRPANSKQWACSQECKGRRLPWHRSQKCVCGCGELTSGRPHYKKGYWSYPRYIRGHNLPAASKRPRPSSEAPTGGSAAFISAVREELRARGATFGWLKGKTGIDRNTVARPSRKRIETVVRIAAALDMDLAESLVEAGWPRPRAMALAVLHLLRTMTRAEIAEHLGISRQTVDSIMKGTHDWWRPSTVRQMGQRLGLPDAVIKDEMRRGQCGHKVAMKLGAENRSPAVKEAHADRLKELSRESPEWRHEAVRKGVRAKSRKRSNKNLEEGPKTLRLKGEERVQAYLDALKAMASQGIDPLAFPYWGRIRAEVRGSNREAYRARKIWIMSRKIT